jgi:hypothetical protein
MWPTGLIDMGSWLKPPDKKDLVQGQIEQGDKMGYLGDQIMDPNGAKNQQNLRAMSQMFNAGNANYGEIAASQGQGGSIAGMQQAAAKRQSGLLTGSQFGQMMNQNQQTAAGYYGQANQAYGQAAQTNQGLLSLQYQDQWEKAKLAQQQKQYEDSQGSFWDDLLTTGLGVAGTVLGGPAGGAAGGLLGKWLGGNDSKSSSSGANYPGFQTMQSNYTPYRSPQPNYTSLYYK